MMRMMYLCVWMTWLSIFWNWITFSFIWFKGLDDDAATYFLWSSMYTATGIPGAWVMWYRPVYYACRDRGSGKWMFFFLNFALHFIFCALMACGIPSTNGVGVILFIDMWNKGDSTVATIFCLVGTLAWGFTALFSMYLLKAAHSKWSSGGGEKLLKQDVGFFY